MGIYEVSEKFIIYLDLEGCSEVLSEGKSKEENFCGKFYGE